MAIDIRATVSCSLGTLISGSLSDDYVQGTGLIKCRGSVELSGLLTPAIGTAVTFSYTKGGTTTSIPRKLRVLSSFADPFRRTTEVELGCKLTYLQDLQEKVDWTAFDDPGNAAFSAADEDYVTIPISASSVMTKCLTALGISASSNPLTNYFSVAKYDLSPGYVSVLNDLLVSESYCGYLDASEVLQVFALDQAGGTGPVLDQSKLIELGPIGVGQLPGEAVTVSYSYQRLKRSPAPEQPAAPSVQTSTSSSRNTLLLSYTNPQGQQVSRAYNNYQATTTTTRYGLLVTAAGETVNVVTSRVTEIVSSAASALGGYFSALLAVGIEPNNPNIVKRTIEVYEYDRNGDEVLRETTTIGSQAYAIGESGLQLVFSATDYVSFFVDATYPLEQVLVRSSRNGEFLSSVTYTFGSWYRTIAGQQSLAESRNSLGTAAAVSAFIDATIGQLHLIQTDSTSSATAYRGQRGPTAQQAINQIYGEVVDNAASLVLAVGSATAQRRIELSMPKASDDRFTKTGSFVYGLARGDAEAKARRFGRAQNRLLLGNRSGMNVQTAPEYLPAAPFSPVVVQANGLSALYRTNGSSWTMNASGLVVSSDLLFWGAVGGTGSFWFPVAPGISSLPTTPAVVNGQMTVDAVVPPFNERVDVAPRVRSLLVLQTYDYGLAGLSSVALPVRSTVTAASIVPVAVPAADISAAAATPAVAISGGALIPAGEVAVAALAPVVTASAVLDVPAADVSVLAELPELLAGNTLIVVPVADVSVSGLAPGIDTGDADYWSNWVAQNFGFEVDVYPEWWAS